MNQEVLADYVHKRSSNVPSGLRVGSIRDLKKLIDRYGPYDQGYEDEAIINIPTPTCDREA